MKIKKQMLYLFLLTLFVVNGVIVSFRAEFISNYVFLIRFSLISAGLLLFPYIKLFLQRKYQILNIIIFCIIGSIMLSALMNINQYMQSIWVSVTFSLRILIFAWFCEYLDYKKQIFSGTKFLYLICLFYCILSDILMLIKPYRIILPWGGFDEYYLIGTKFSLTYLHLFTVMLYCLIYKDIYNKKKLPFFVMIIWMFSISIYTRCTTMVIGTIIFFLLSYIDKFVNFIFKRPIIIMLYTLLCNFVLLINSAILHVPIVKYIIEEFLNESIELTGRINIYSKIVDAISVAPWFGVALDNNYFVSVLFTNAADLQNGLFDLMLSYGIIGTMFFGIILLYVVLICKKNIPKAAASVIFIYITLSSIEITFRIEIFLAFFIAVLWSWYQTPDNVFKYNEEYKKGSI